MGAVTEKANMRCLNILFSNSGDSMKRISAFPTGAVSGAFRFLCDHPSSEILHAVFPDA